MAGGIFDRDRTYREILQAIVDRITRLERPNSIHYGGAGTGFTVYVDTAGRLVAASDAHATVTVIALP